MSLFLLLMWVWILQIIRPDQSVARGCRCCCGCGACFGVGYWSEYTVTISGATSNTQFNTTLTLPRQGRVDDGEGTGGCTYFNTTGSIRVVLSHQFGYWFAFAYEDPFTGTQPGFRGSPETGECRSSFVLQATLPGDPSLPPGAPSGTDILGSGAIATFTPSGTWTSCGQDADGDPVEDDGEPLARLQSNRVRLAVVSSPPQRPIRCTSFTGRTQRVHGCSGWKSRGGCLLDLPAVPGKFCQTECTKYVPDPDYEEAGPSGWLQ